VRWGSGQIDRLQKHRDVCRRYTEPGWLYPNEGRCASASAGLLPASKNTKWLFAPELLKLPMELAAHCPHGVLVLATGRYSASVEEHYLHLMRPVPIMRGVRIHLDRDSEVHRG